MRNHKALRRFAILAGLFAAGCGPRQAADSRALVVIDGSSTVYPLSHNAREGFAEQRPGVTVVVDNHGTTGGFDRYLKGEVDIVDASRPARPEEEAKAKASGRDWTRFTVGYDGITVVVNSTNDFVKELSVEQLKRLFEPESTVITWKDLDASWPDRPIKLFSPDPESGTFDFFTEVVVGRLDAQRPNVVTSSDDNVLVTGVVADPDGLAYFGYAYFEANANHLRAVPLRADADAPAVSPSPTTIMDGTYKPLGRPLYIYVKNSSLKRPEVADFVRYYLENVVSLARVTNYVAPKEEDRAANSQALKGLSQSL